MKMKKFLVFGLVSVTCLSVRSQILKHNEEMNRDSTGHTITVIQSSSLNQLLKYNATAVDEESTEDENVGSISENVSNGRTAGYRVQVFSDNNQRTAKNEARSKEQLLKEAFPDFETYIIFNSPFWRLKIGDFKTQHEADAAADAIKSRFPSFSREVRVVRDRINIHR